ncbi:PREDICTED: membrane metallo-endopeptidase-like 1 isoform X4 [Wasmannia auropunctata]|uniref:membrane metallo-endopeptidase-like 1 isoform X4 n=1 Tax=Wasmannia auropunctata TaxID=64793 RepID=UPI0005F0602C|nr:PREDICTED: membrane metallo-endopeptidase-like 1 isoform X4 [Wasmannia auropunctata]
MTNGTKQMVIKNPIWWKRRSRMERRLTVIAVFGFLLCIALAIALGILATNMTCNTTSKTVTLNDANTSKYIMPNKMIYNDVCLTPGCVHAASQVIKNMNPDVEPCDDFYKFACGGFIESTIIPDDKYWVTTFSAMIDDIEKQLRLSIEQDSPSNELKPFKLAKNFYKSCMNKTAIEQKGLTPLLNNLRKLGGWPVLDGEKWNEDDFIWKDSVYKFRRLGYSPSYFIDISINQDWKNSSRYLINLNSPGFGLGREYMTKDNEKIVEAYYEYVVDIAVMLGANPDRARKELEESVQFELNLASCSPPFPEQRNLTLLYNPMTVSELSAAYPKIPWWEYLNTILAPKVQLSRDDIVIVLDPGYLKGFEKLINTTPKRVQANYALWRATAESVKYLTDDIRKRQLKYTTVLNGKTEREPRWKECINTVFDSVMIISISSMYVRKYFKEDAKKTAFEMVDNIRQEFMKILNKVEWMNEKTKTNALEKATAMTLHIAYPNELLDDRKLEEYYEKFELSADDYIGNAFNLHIYLWNFIFSKLRQPAKKTEWLIHAARSSSVNAYYSPFENSIGIAAGILQGVFFSNDRPKYMNYGGIGCSIGHEITHGFDDQGRQFDKEGNLVDWWDPETNKRYLQRTECIIYQYGNYTVKEVGMNLNGIDTLGENIADNGGVKEAYYAYKEWVKRNNPEQMFWISAANTFCSKYRPEALKLQIMSDFHSPYEFRINGPLSNMEEFSRDFNCPIGSRMNPEKKCTVW